MSRIHKPSLQRWLKRIGIAVLMTALVVPVGVLPKGAPDAPIYAAEEKSNDRGLAANYKTAQVTRGDVIRYATAGPEVKWLEEYPLFFPYEGAVLEEILVRDNAWVEKGDPLLRFQREVPESSLARLELQKDQLEATQKDERAALEARRQQFEAEGGEHAKRQLERLAIEEAMVEDRQAFERTEIQAQIDRLNEDYQTTELVAPADGMITGITRMRPGERIGADTPLMVYRNPKKALLALDDRSELFPYGREVEVTFGFANDPMHSKAVVVDNPTLGTIAPADAQIYLEVSPEDLADAAQAMGKDPETFTLADLNNVRVTVEQSSAYDCSTLR